LELYNITKPFRQYKTYEKLRLKPVSPRLQMGHSTKCRIIAMNQCGAIFGNS